MSADGENRGCSVSGVMAFQRVMYSTTRHSTTKVEKDQQLSSQQAYSPLLIPPTINTRLYAVHVTRSNFLSTIISTPCAITVTAATLAFTVDTKESAATNLVSHTSTQSHTLSLDTTSSLITNNQLKSSQSTWEQSITGLISGATLTAAKTIVKYPLDTATVRLQMTDTTYSIFQPISLFRGSFDGITPQLVGTIPSGAVFFAVKDVVKAYLSNSWISKTMTQGLDWNAIMSTCIAVAVAQPPYWLIRNPSEVIKTREQVGYYHHHHHDDTTHVNVLSLWALNTTTTWDGLRDLYTGYWENIIYAYPADVIKFVLYETLVSSSLQRQKKGTLSLAQHKDGMKIISESKKAKVGPMEGALYGAIATAISQCITTPLDVVRNRIMVESTFKNVTSPSLSYVESLTELARNEGMSGLFAGVGPKIAKAFLSGAIQFAAYEETSQSIQSMFDTKEK